MNNENQNVEWKESWRDEYLKWICGFANAQGGVLSIGVRDDGTVCGVSDAKRLMEDIPNKIRDVLGIMVDVNCEKRDEKDVLEIRVASAGYPVNYKGEYHYRSGSTKQLLKGRQLTEFLLKKVGYRWDAEPEPYYKAEDLDREAIELFKREALRHGRMTREDLELSNFELMDRLQLVDKDGRLLRAAVMAFYRYPDKIAIGAYTKIGFFENDADLIYQDEVHGALLVQAERVMDLIYTKYLKAKISYDNITRIETFPFPRLAIREAVFNALVHNNYARGIPIQISVYEDKIYIANDIGNLEIWTPEKLMGKHRSVQTNPGIANVFFRCGFIEAWGRGIEKICRECDHSGNKHPVYEVTESGIMARFDALEANAVAGINAGANDDASNDSCTLNCTTNGEDFTKDFTKEIIEKPKSEIAIETIIQCIEDNSKVRVEDMAKVLNLSTRRVKYYLRILRKKNVIEHFGSRKFGEWKVVGKKNDGVNAE